MKVILFSGKAEAGKTTAANMLKDLIEARHPEKPKRAVIIPYGAYVKYTAKLLFGWDGVKDEYGRNLLQWWGTDVVRKKDMDFWVLNLYRLATVIDNIFDYLIIDDCRFPNEVVSWEYAGYQTTLVRVERPGYENHLTPEQRMHPSETSLDTWEFDYKLVAVNKNELLEEVRTKLLPII